MEAAKHEKQAVICINSQTDSINPGIKEHRGKINPLTDVRHVRAGSWNSSRFNELLKGTHALDGVWVSLSVPDSHQLPKLVPGHPHPAWRDG
ncbi:hypothetical protein TNCT_126221 [Trichonephila clavata]|uniref:Uncharacterized protein n=1 Tax=Trichonephila clavata TaxID=2740835 RepID=A0A8X6G244_TRICU|nr:hypothetical protein TNCT_126221 [Trichonephila clavata]